MNSVKSIKPLGTYILLILLQMTAVFELSMTLSMAPVIVNRLSILPNNFAYTTLGFVAFGLFTPFIGVMAQRWGLKPVIYLLNLLTLVGSFGVMFTQNAYFYTMARSFLGLAFLSLLALIPSTIVIYSPQKRIGLISGFFKLTFALGILLAPPVGLVLLKKFGFESIYMVVIILTLLLGLTNTLLPELPHSQKKEIDQSISPQLKPLKKKGFMLFSLSALFSPAPIVLVTTYYSLYLAASGVPQQEISFLYSLLGMGSVGAGIFIIFFSDRVGKVFSALLGVLFLLISHSTLLFSSGIILMVVLFLLYLGMDIFTGMFFPTVSLSYPGEGHALLTQLTAYSSLGMVILTLIAPLIYNAGFHINVLSGFILILLSGVSYMGGLKRARGFILKGDR